VLALALALDAAFGEPEALWRRVPHPVVLIGRSISALEAWLNQGVWRRAKGVTGLVLLLMPLGAAAWALSHPALYGVAEVALAAILLAQRSLVEHVGAVADGLDQGLVEGRQAVAMIVGRDPEQLDEAGVARAAIESAAENFSDGLVAPAFWFAVGGLPGIVLYKAVNTADSMIGHRNDRHAAFGGFAARLDDVANLVPARLTGLLIAVASLKTRAFIAVVRDARRHRSPNAGWPEAAMAGGLGVRLSGPRTYGSKISKEPWLNGDAPDPTGDDVHAGLVLYKRAMALAALVLIVLAWSLRP